MSEMRLQVLLSKAGVASRRAAEKLISEGRVTVNGEIVTEMGSRADPDKDVVLVDGEVVGPEQEPAVIAMHKPMQVMTTLEDPEGRETVANITAEEPFRFVPVGRLDYLTEGLLLLTTDGALMNRLLHPKYHVPKVYVVKVRGHVKKEALDKLREGVQLDDGPTQPAVVQWLGEGARFTWLEIIVTEGRNRLVRRMCEAIGHTALRVVRTELGTIRLDGLRPGQYRYLEPGELKGLYNVAKLGNVPKSPDRVNEVGYAPIGKARRGKGPLPGRDLPPEDHRASTTRRERRLHREGVEKAERRRAEDRDSNRARQDRLQTSRGPGGRGRGGPRDERSGRGRRWDEGGRDRDDRGAGRGRVDDRGRDEGYRSGGRDDGARGGYRQDGGPRRRDGERSQGRGRGRDDRYQARDRGWDDRSGGGRRRSDDGYAPRGRGRDDRSGDRRRDGDRSRGRDERFQARGRSRDDGYSARRSDDRYQDRDRGRGRDEGRGDQRSQTRGPRDGDDRGYRRDDRGQGRQQGRGQDRRGGRDERRGGYEGRGQDRGGYEARSQDRRGRDEERGHRGRSNEDRRRDSFDEDEAPRRGRRQGAPRGRQPPRGQASGRGAGRGASGRKGPRGSPRGRGRSPRR